MNNASYHSRLVEPQWKKNKATWLISKKLIKITKAQLLAIANIKKGDNQKTRN